MRKIIVLLSIVLFLVSGCSVVKLDNTNVGKNIKIFTGNSHPELAKEIADTLGLPLGKAKVSTFSDGEISVDIGETVRGADVFVVQSTSSPVNNNLMELLIMIDAFKRASAGRITVVMPYYGYARQDRKDWIYSEEQNPDLVIVSKEEWEKAQEIREARKNKMNASKEKSFPVWVFISAVIAAIFSSTSSTIRAVPLPITEE